MEILEMWAAQEGISRAALDRLAGMYAMHCGASGGVQDGRAESYVQSAIRLEAPKYNVLPMRNNVGALMDDRGVPVRYGLMNDSKQLNERIKSSDLICISRKLITPADVGKPRGQFVARECKRDGWKYSGDKHERAQLEFINLVNAWGGDASFACGPGSFV